MMVHGGRRRDIRGERAGDGGRRYARTQQLLRQARTIDSGHPACVLIVVDRSTSITSVRPARSSAWPRDRLAETANGLLYGLWQFATAYPCIRENLWVGAIRYSDSVAKGFVAAGAAEGFTTIGCLGRQLAPSLDWIETGASGSTAMCEALGAAAGMVRAWSHRHVQGFPPVVIHLTDGQATDGDPDYAIEDLTATRTHRGRTLLVNVLFSERQHEQVALPASEKALRDGISRKFFRTASRVPPWLRPVVHAMGMPAPRSARSLLVNIDIVRRLRRIAPLPSPVRRGGCPELR